MVSEEYTVVSNTEVLSLRLNFVSRSPAKTLHTILNDLTTDSSKSDDDNHLTTID